MKKWIIDPGQQIGKNDSSIEMFRKGESGALGALVREDIQNSLDAVRVKSQPVKVVFKVGKVDRLPNQEELISIYNRIKNSPAWGHKYDEDINDVINILTQDSIDVLKVSDYNTTGAAGASSYQPYSRSTPWKALTEISGDTQKSSEGSAGSFGIGKNANRAITPLRALFFTSKLADESDSYSQGWMTYASIVEQSTKEYPKGFASSNSFFYKNQTDLADKEPASLAYPIKGEIPEFAALGNRLEAGTDIYMPGIKIYDDLQMDIIENVLSNFLVSIYHNLLEVEIDLNNKETVIMNSSNLEALVNKVTEKNADHEIENYYKALTQQDAKYIFKMPVDGKFIFNDDDISFNVYKFKDNETGTRKALLTRNIGMRITEYPEKGQRGFAGGINFSAVLLVHGKYQNRLLQEIENPEHNKWNNKDQLEANPEAKKLLEKIKKFMRDSVKKLLPETSDEVAAYGLEDLLANNNINHDLEIDDHISTHIAKVEIKNVAKPINRKKAQSLRGKHGHETLVGKGTKKSKIKGKSKKGLQRNSQLGGGSGNDYMDFTDYLQDLKSKHNGNQYQISFKTASKLVNPQIEFEVIGDSSIDTGIKINHATLQNGDVVEVDKNKIMLKNHIFNINDNIDLFIDIEESEPIGFNVKLLSQSEGKNED